MGQGESDSMAASGIGVSGIILTPLLETQRTFYLVCGLSWVMCLFHIFDYRKSTQLFLGEAEMFIVFCLAFHNALFDSGIFLLVTMSANGERC